MSYRSVLALILLALLCAWAGYFIGTASKESKEPSQSEHSAKTWTCSMHPSIKQPEKGKCPICAMDLIPLSDSDDQDLGERELKMSPAAMALAQIRTSTVKKAFLDYTMDFVGKIDFDERRVKVISSYLDGRLERLFVDYSGVPVRKGEHLVKIYSPNLYSAQEELLQAKDSYEDMLSQNSSHQVLRNVERNYLASKEKLSLLGLKEDQLAKIIERDSPSATVEIKAPIGGIVIEKFVEEGQYVETGDPIYQVADLSKVWAEIEVYESSLAWIRYGQDVELKTVSYGDKTFQGWVSFIDPVLNEKTRAVTIRIVVNNEEGLLKPNMLISARIRARMGAEGKILANYSRGQWLCPMHPEEASKKAADCPVCKMDMHRAEDLGYASKEEVKEALLIPASAVLYTGKRGVVYVKTRAKDQEIFKGVEVRLGPRSDDYYIVRAGLREGWEVASHGQFKIDSSLQIQGKTSMMSPMERRGEVLTTPPEVASKMLETLFQGYLPLHEALSQDSPQKCMQKAKEMASQVEEEKSLERLKEILEQLGKRKSLQRQRKKFQVLSGYMERLLRYNERRVDFPVHVFHCSMAFKNKGAKWLQGDKKLLNPYFGSSMLRCGLLKDSLGGEQK